MLAKRKFQFPPGKGISIHKLLVIVGLDLNKVYASHDGRYQVRKRALWTRYPDPWILAWDAREAFERRIKEVHPDHGGDEEEAKEVIAAWSRLKHIFEKKGVKI